MSDDDSHFSRGEQNQNRRRKSKGTSNKSVLEEIADDTPFCYGDGTPPSEEYSPVGSSSPQRRPITTAFSCLETVLNDMQTPPSKPKTKHKRDQERQQNKANRFSLTQRPEDPLDMARSLQSSSNKQFSNSQERRSKSPLSNKLERRQPQENNIHSYNNSNGGNMRTAKRRKQDQSLQNKTRNKSSSPQQGAIICIDQEEEEDDHHGRSTKTHRTARTQQKGDSLMTCSSRSNDSNRVTHGHAMKDPPSPSSVSGNVSIGSDPITVTKQQGSGKPRNKDWANQVKAASMVVDQCLIQGRIPRKNPNHRYSTESTTDLHSITQTQIPRRNSLEQRAKSAPPGTKRMINTRDPTDLAKRVVHPKPGFEFKKVNSTTVIKKKSKGTRILPGNALNSYSRWAKEMEDEIESCDSTPEKRTTNGRKAYGKHHPRIEAERRSTNDLTWQNDENKRSQSSTADRALDNITNASNSNIESFMFSCQRSVVVPRSNGVDASNFHGKQTLAPVFKKIQKKTQKSPPRRRSARKKRSNSVIEIDLDDSSDSEDDRRSSSSRERQSQSQRPNLMTQEAELQLSNKEMMLIQKEKSKREWEEVNNGEEMLNKRSFGGRFQLGIVRIAIGSQLFSSGCSLSFQPSTKQPFFLLEYKKNADTLVDHKISLDDASMEEMRYFIAEEGEEGEPSDEDNIPMKDVKSQEPLSETDDQPMSFLAMKVKPDGYNKLGNYRSYYKDVQNDSNGSEYLATHYIVLESRSNQDFISILETMRKNESLAAFLQEESRVEKSQVSKYTKALMEDTEKDRKLRSSSLQHRSRSLRSGGKGTVTTDDPDEVLLVYPFVSDSKALDASSLAFDNALGFDTSRHSPTESDKR
eukprot:scaffold39273_cov53-Attheya_sp.AAC.1